jgi:ABC-type antimicrobial peptide transport system permease subunit
MKFHKFIIRSIIHYRRQHLALFLGMAVSAAVLTGALVVGDSIRHSLNRMVDTRLGKTRFAIAGGARFIESGLAGRLEQAIKVPVSPFLMLRGIVIRPDSGIRINRAGIIGIDSSFMGISGSPFQVPGDDEAIISRNIADRLHFRVGEELLIRVESANLIPVNATFAREPAPSVALRLKITAIATDDQLGRFNLGNDQSNPCNVFVSLSFLGRKLDLRGLANILLVAGEKGRFTSAAIKDSVQSNWSLKDLGLSVEKRMKEGYYNLISNRVFIDTAVQQVIEQAEFPHWEVISYMVNDIAFKEKHTPYSFASAVSSSISGKDLNEHEVIINRWTAADLGARAGDSIKLSYFEIGALRELRETSRHFQIKYITDNITNQIDSSLMPKFQGLSEAGNCRDWDAGVPIDLKRIRDKDEKYWDDYRGTPKVLLSMKAGRKLWKNPFGTLTAIRFEDAEVDEKKLEDVLLQRISPSDIGIQVVDVRNEGARAAKNAIDFTELFLGLSFFVIVASIMLTVLIYSLHFSRRSAETALLSGLGFNSKSIIRLRFAESSIVMLLGSIAGSLLGILYNYALIAGLNTIWNDIVRTDMLVVHVRTTSLLAGVIFSVLISLVPIYIVTSRRLKHPVAGQLRDHTKTGHPLYGHKNKSVLPGYILLGLSSLLVLYSIVFAGFENAILYLGAAALFLGGSLFLVNGILRSIKSPSNVTVPTTGRLAVRNLTRNPGRSLSVIALLALGTFTIALTGAYRKTFYGTGNLRNSGTGGYLLWAETTSPVPINLNRKEGRDRLITGSIHDLDGVRFLQFDRLEGDDASCLNLNQAQRPRLLAVNPAVFDSVQAFSFVKLLPGLSLEHPWSGLEDAFNDSTFPAYADQTVIQYSLKRKLGDTLVYHGESGKAFRLVLAGSLSNSVFQGNILLSDKVFRKQFPSSGGSRIILTDAPAKKQSLIIEVLSRSLIDYGIEVTPASQRLATFNSVENTYLTVFMVLSGLGFIIGTIGLGIILLRNIYERRQEFALMISMGYSRKQIFSIVFTENVCLLSTGFLTGLMSAIVGILPSLLSPSFKVQGEFVIMLTTVIFISGLLWIYFPLKGALRKPLITALRGE